MGELPYVPGTNADCVQSTVVPDGQQPQPVSANTAQLPFGLPTMPSYESNPNTQSGQMTQTSYEDNGGAQSQVHWVPMNQNDDY